MMFRSNTRWYCSAPVAQNLVEKIAQRFVVDGKGEKLDSPVRSGDFVSIKPERVMTHDNTAAVIPKFQSLGENVTMHDNKQVFFGLDHDVQNTTSKNLEKYKKIEEFSKKHNVPFSKAGHGIVHQVMVENGFAYPGTLVVASDSHSNMYGGIGCLGTPVVRTDAAAIWATGQTWWTVPPVAKVELTGVLPKDCSGKDVIITLCGVLNKDEVLNHAIEFTGPAVANLTIDDRLTMANMTTEWGALAGVFPIDETTVDWVSKRENWAGSSKLAFPEAKDLFSSKRLTSLVDSTEKGEFTADEGAFYNKEITLDLSTVTPSVAGPNTVKKMTSSNVLSKQKIAVNKAYLLSCTNSRASDISAAAKILSGKKVPDGVEFYVAAASESVKQEAESAGDWQTLMSAGAVPLPSGCGPCIGMGIGLLEKGEVGISATNRNFKGRMGHPDAKCYLASPSVVAASALAGYITSPETAIDKDVKFTCKTNKMPKGNTPDVKLLDGFGSTITGRLVFVHEDNLNTDGIYAGKHTYSDLTPGEMAEVAFENYDPKFQEVAEVGSIVVGGYNFGSGSSREQAATCLKYKGIPLVIAGSFSETYKRNAFNNGLPALESPALVSYLKETLGTKQATFATYKDITLHLITSTVSFDGKEFPVAPLGVFAQEICLAGGLEGWVSTRLSSASQA
eukprot:TRINITY_DN7072_c0_g1_i2.p1 TRINITY_DN7072_c0_g1~~TRINITY_DN7072_c0_g1_i2.p1  ORF type:complete len:676 (+),score=97.92 TRINITY_DN7072_c0_g1_i2:70-2097(+)